MSQKNSIRQKTGPWPNFEFNKDLSSGSPESNLWKRVIILFAQDLEAARNVYLMSRNGECKKARKEIYSLLFQLNNPWFKEVCSLANVDYLIVKKVCLEMLETKVNFYLNEYY